MEGFSPEKQKKLFLQLVTLEMPFGKYKGRLICDLPEHYLVWYRQKGLPKGNLGILMETIYEIKLNGLEDILKPIRTSRKTKY
jgi:uncharacterized protein (DUF3820 family)